MDAELYSALGDQVLLVALSVTRIAIAFVLLPLFSQDSVPGLVRNSIFVSLAIITIAVQPVVSVESLSVAEWLALFAKEALIGTIIGLFFGVYLWAFEAAGVVVDMQIGASFALFFDPIVGNEVTLIGQFLSRWAVWLFVVAGGLLLFAGALIESFGVWPVTTPLSGLREASVTLFQVELSRFMSLTLRIASPLMLVLFLIDVAMGLLNRYAPQFNVFFLSMSVKSMAAVLLLVILLPYLAEVMIDQISLYSGDVTAILERILVR